MSSSSEMSVVEWFADHEGYRCGYCKSPDTNYSHGMSGHSLTVQDYQDLIDRGWRRSGKYLYKPTLTRTCCPQYTIRCSALDFKMSKSQRQVINRVNRFINQDIKPSASDTVNEQQQQHKPQPKPGVGADPNKPRCMKAKDLRKAKREQKISNAPAAAATHPTTANTVTNTAAAESAAGDRAACSAAGKASCSAGDTAASIAFSAAGDKAAGSATGKAACSAAGDKAAGSATGKAACSAAGDKAAGSSTGKAACSAAGDKAACSAAGKGSCSTISGSGRGDEEQSLEDLLNDRVEKPAHKLELRLVRSSPRNETIDRTLSVSHSVYVKYQTSVHGDKPEEVNMKKFTRFLVDSPLIPESESDSHINISSVGYGSFHQQYWLDGVLIAVGVIDILPHCVSSVYLFYDPEYSFLSLGTYSALQELALTRSLHRTFSPHISYYYMGFYIQSCPKMRYKGQYYPSYLLCPETYQWFPLSQCKTLLEKNKYSRFNPDLLQDDEESRSVDVDSVLCLHSHRAMLFSEYCNKKKREGKGGVGEDERKSVALYARLTGAKCAHSMMLYRK